MERNKLRRPNTSTSLAEPSVFLSKIKTNYEKWKPQIEGPSKISISVIGRAFGPLDPDLELHPLNCVNWNARKGRPNHTCTSFASSSSRLVFVLHPEWRKRQRKRKRKRLEAALFREVEAEAEAEAVMKKLMEAEAEAEAVKRKSMEAEAEAEAVEA